MPNLKTTVSYILHLLFMAFSYKDNCIII